jgi:hypothetical protein
LIEREQSDTIALEDVAAANAVHEKALHQNIRISLPIISFE